MGCNRMSTQYVPWLTKESDAKWFIAFKYPHIFGRWDAIGCQHSMFHDSQRNLMQNGSLHSSTHIFLGRVCQDTCNNQGCILPFDVKLSLFKSFRQKSYNEQSLYLSGCMVQIPVKRRTVQDAEASRRQSTFKYAVKVNGSEYAVCRKTFCDIFAVTPSRLQMLQGKEKVGKNLEDQRGKHANRPHAIIDNVKELVREHIRSFPAYENHYSRSRTEVEKKYLQPNLNLKMMHGMFKEKHGSSTAQYWLYRQIFMTDFKHLKFGQPRSDTCKTCDKYYIQMCAETDPQKQTKLQEESELHHRKAEKGYKTLSADTERAKNNPNVVVLCCDLQQVLFTPQLTHSSVFYRQLSNFNFCVHNTSTGCATMCLWDETIARRGSAEIASCIWKYIQANFDLLQPHQDRSLILWSDRCIGQNNNWRMISLALYLIRKGFFTSVEQKFLTTGHSFLPCDRNFALIEKKRVSSVMVPSEWKKLIEESRPSQPFQVLEMEQQFFKDFSKIDEAYIRPTQVKITGALWIKLISDDPGHISLRSSHNELAPWKTHSLLPVNRNRGRKTTIITNFHALRDLDLQPLYACPLPIKPQKLHDLLDMCQYLKPEHAAFYRGLVAANDDDTQDV